MTVATTQTNNDPIPSEDLPQEAAETPEPQRTLQMKYTPVSGPLSPLPYVIGFAVWAVLIYLISH